MTHIIMSLVVKELKHLTVDQKVLGLNPTCCFSSKVFSLPQGPPPLGDQPWAERPWK